MTSFTTHLSPILWSKTLQSQNFHREQRILSETGCAPGTFWHTLTNVRDVLSQPLHLQNKTYCLSYSTGGGRSVWNEEASNFSIINFQVDVIFRRMEVEAIELPWPSSLRVRRSCCRASPPGLPQSFPVCWAQTVEVRCLCPSPPPSSCFLSALLSRLSLLHILQVNNMMGDIFLVFPLNLPSAK